MSGLRYWCTHCERALSNGNDRSPHADTVTFAAAKNVYTHDQCGGWVELSEREAAA